MGLRTQAALALGLIAASSLSANAQILYSGGTATENFNSLPGLPATNSLSFTANTVATSVGGTTFDIDQIGGSTATTYKLIPDTGGLNSGALYAYESTTDSTDKALGSVASGGVIGGFGVVITNSGADTYSSFNIGFNSEEYRTSTSTQNVLTFASGVSGGTITAANYLTSADMTANAAFNIVGDAPVTTNGALATPLSTPVSGTLAVTLAPGQSLFLRWSDANDVGNDAGLAIDDFSITGSTGVASPEPASLGVLGVSGLLLLRRRSR